MWSTNQDDIEDKNEDKELNIIFVENYWKKISKKEGKIRTWTILNF